LILKLLEALSFFCSLKSKEYVSMKVAQLALCIAWLALIASNAFAAERFTYDANAFQDALNAGKHILVHITAPWCGECKAQKPIVAALADTPEFKNLTIFDIDFDTQKDALRQLHVLKQSTLIAFKDKAEVGRAVGITRKEAIEALMKKAL